MKKRLFVLIVVMLCMSIGCAKTDEPQIPELKVICNEKDIEVQRGGYSWTRKVGLFNSESIIVDAASPEQIASKMNGDNIKSFSKLELDFNKKPQSFDVIYVDTSVDTKEMKYRVEENSIVLLKESGTYVFEIIGKWEEGTASYTIKVLVNKN